jgi:hypothetical protein
MPTCTPIYGLTYPICSDPPCNVGDTFCEFVNGVEEQFDRLDGIVDRTVDTVPMAKVRLTTPYTFGPTTSNFTTALPFDTVDVDTADLVNLTNDATRITLPRFGVYGVGWQIVVSSVALNDRVIGTFQNLQDTYLSDAAAIPVYLNGAGIVRYASSSAVSPTDTITGLLSLQLSVLIGTFTVTEAFVNIYWLRDLP